MSTVYDTVNKSVRTNGRDTKIRQPTNFLGYQHTAASSTSLESQSKYEVWTESHSLRSKVRRERRESNPKVPIVAVVEDFNVSTYKADANVKKWRFWT